MDGITKTFPGVVALSGASLRVGRGEVHALVGQNGAGKSTLVRILTGAHRRDSGEVVFAGQPVDFRSPQAAQRAGVSTIYQEINLVPYRSIAENIFLGREPRRFGLLDWRAMNRNARDLLRRLDISLDVTRPLYELNVALQQMVALARALSFESKLVVLDEPTSSLDEREVQTLFAVIRGLKQNGVSVLFITHRLDELYAVCDRVTIMRDGQTVAERAIPTIQKLELVATMLGKELGEVRQEGQTGFDQARRTARRTGPPMLEARNLRREPALRGASLSLRAGETIGLAGLLGSGRTEVARAIFAADRLDGGEVEFGGGPARFHGPAHAIRAGIGLCGEDRKAEGIIPYLSVRENLTLAALPTLTTAGIVDRKRQRAIVDRFITRLGIKASSPEQPVRELSGGNQQKVLLARWLCLHPKLLILDEPTRGIDVGAKAEIQALIDELAGQGLSVLMISSELEEILEGADRVAVMRDGETVAILDHAEVSQDRLLSLMAHGHEDDAALANSGPPIANDVAPDRGDQRGGR
ncbi:MAG: sugar ABC transporter ATP-binding protein [Chloroflexia bacterium]|nr:sugar ABC transporter ATP-binding protein [Chloroflexia bacterium]